MIGGCGSGPARDKKYNAGRENGGKKKAESWKGVTTEELSQSCFRLGNLAKWKAG